MGARKPVAWARMFFAVAMTALTGTTAHATPEPPYCGTEGVWIQTLGGGGPELSDGQGGASYLIWLDDTAKVLIDPAPGSSLRFDEAGADFADLDAILLTHLHVDHAGDLPAFVKGSYFAERTRLLPVIGPDGNDRFPDTVTFVNRLIGPEGAFPYLADFLTSASSGGYKLSVRNVPATGNRRWARFGTQTVRTAAMPVHHGGVPAIAWRVEIGDTAIVITGDFNNQKNVIAKFAKGADALVITHAIPEIARGTARDLHVIPSQIGQIAEQAGVRMVILGHRMSRTRGRESQSREALEARYLGPLIFANDLECWGL